MPWSSHLRSKKRFVTGGRRVFKRGHRLVDGACGGELDGGGGR